MAKTSEKRPAGKPPLEDLIGESPGIAAARQMIERLFRHQSYGRKAPPILIQGETGTGKGLVARAIHRAGPRADGPFVDVNCAAIPETLLEAEMFGFERGAFTDARQPKAGLFQAAHRGTIFLDEVGLLPDGPQAKLLKVIEERVVRRLGSTRNEPVEVWILTATSMDLAAAMRERRFREDLFHRLAVVTLWLPPLRERGRDILLLANHFLAKACADYQVPPKTLAPDAGAALMAYPWPGNVRELGNVIERVALLAEARLVTAAMLGLPERHLGERRQPPRGEKAVRLGDAMSRLERSHLLEALRETNWNITHAATRLGIPRNTLRYRIEKHGLRPIDSGSSARHGRERTATPAPATGAAVPAAVPTGSGIRWERRRLTLLRVVLESRREEKSPLESSREIEILVEKVQSFHGRVEELGPRGITAVFGIEAVEDAPRRAALSAMAILRGLEQTQAGGTDRVAIKIGIHLKKFLLGRIGGMAEIDQDGKRQAWTVLEDLVQRPVSGTIGVTEEAAAFLERRFDLVPLASLEGIAGRVYYRLAGREGAGLGLRGRMARFVGRHHELNLLHTRLAYAMRGQGQVVGIGGEAGIGKSRLLFEFRQSLAAQRITFLEGRCHSYGSTIPHLPIQEMLRNNCRVTESDSPELVAEKVRQGLQEVGMDPDQGAPYLLELLGVRVGTDRLAELSAEAIWSRTFDILRRMSLKGSRRRPLILAMEDLHWIDKASEAYFAALVESLSGAPILFLFTYRSGYRPPWVEKSYATQISLQPLGPQDSLSLVEAVLQSQHVPDAVKERILAKAEGNPFFLEELARAVAEQGNLRAPVAVPETIQEVILGRINRLPDEPRRLLQTASVLGREVSLRVLAALWEGPGDLQGHLRELARLEFLVEGAGADDPVYCFKDALIQEVAYESLLLTQRQRLHAAAGRALEAFHAERLEEAADRLAYHFSKTEEADKAVEYLARFAEKAARGYAHVEAVSAYQEALGHAQRLPSERRESRLVELVLGQAHSQAFLGRFQETLDLLRREQGRLERLRDPCLAGRYYFWLAHTYSHLDDRELAVQHAQRALEEAGRCGDLATRGKAYLVLAQERYWAGHPQQGIEAGRQAVGLLEQAGERWWLGLAHWVVGINFIVFGEFGPALEAGARAQAIGEAIGDPRIQSYATWITGWIHALKGDHEAGIDACKRGLGHSPDPVNTAVALGDLGYAYLEGDQVGEAVPLLEQSLAQIGRFGFRPLQGRFATFLGEAYLLTGQIEKARTLVTQGLQISREAKYPYGTAWAQLALGRIAQAAGSLLEAEATLKEALHGFATMGARFMLGRTHLAMAELALARANRDAVGTHLTQAHHLFHTLRIPKYVERTERFAQQLGIPIPLSPGP